MKGVGIGHMYRRYLPSQKAGGFVSLRKKNKKELKITKLDDIMFI